MCVGFITRATDDARAVNLVIGAIQRDYDYMIEWASIYDARNWDLSVYWHRYQMNKTSSHRHTYIFDDF